MYHKWQAGHDISAAMRCRFVAWPFSNLPRPSATNTRKTHCCKNIFGAHPEDFLAEHLEEYDELREMGGGELYQAMLAERCHEPVLTPWDP